MRYLSHRSALHVECLRVIFIPLSHNGQAGEGEPVIIVDAFGEEDLSATWSWAALGARHGSSVVLANNRAPARHADAQPGGGGLQRTVALPLRDYIRDHILFANPPASPGSPAPLYANGWRVFSETREPLPALRFAEGVDQTAEIAAAVDKTLLGGGKGSSAQANDPAPLPAWIAAVVTALTKLFLGPAGTVTRLHYDAGSAHGLLAQLAGRKLFVLLPPRATPALHVLASEPETVQSPVDPLDPGSAARWPGYGALRPLAAVLAPGEAILVPQGWWHYAVALEPSLTLQRNFYHAATNAKGLVAMVLGTVAKLRKQT